MPNNNAQTPALDGVARYPNGERGGGRRAMHCDLSADPPMHAGDVDRHCLIGNTTSWTAMPLHPSATVFMHNASCKAAMSSNSDK